MISERAAIPLDDRADGGDVSNGFDILTVKLVVAWAFLVWYIFVWIVCSIGYMQMFVFTTNCLLPPPLVASRSVSDNTGTN